MLPIFIFFLIQIPQLTQPRNFENYYEFAKFHGDLNGDSLMDQIVIYEKKCDPLSDILENDANCRSVAIYLNRGHQLEMHSYNDWLVECSNCGGVGVGDPFRGIKIQYPYFSVEGLKGDCDKTFTVISFKFDSKNKDFYLHKVITENYDCHENPTRNGEIKVKKQTTSKKQFGMVRFSEYH